MVFQPQLICFQSWILSCGTVAYQETFEFPSLGHLYNLSHFLRCFWSPLNHTTSLPSDGGVVSSSSLTFETLPFGFSCFSPWKGELVGIT